MRLQVSLREFGRFSLRFCDEKHDGMEDESFGVIIPSMGLAENPSHMSITSTQVADALQKQRNNSLSFRRKDTRVSRQEFTDTVGSGKAEKPVGKIEHVILKVRLAGPGTRKFGFVAGFALAQYMQSACRSDSMSIDGKNGETRTTYGRPLQTRNHKFEIYINSIYVRSS